MHSTKAMEDGSDRTPTPSSGSPDRSGGATAAVDDFDPGHRMCSHRPSGLMTYSAVGFWSMSRAWRRYRKELVNWLGMRSPRWSHGLFYKSSFDAVISAGWSGLIGGPG